MWGCALRTPVKQLAELRMNGCVRVFVVLGSVADKNASFASKQKLVKQVEDLRLCDILSRKSN